MTEKYELTYRPWGNWEVVREGNYDDVKYKVKFLTIEPGRSISLQYHNHRDEYWTIVKGLAKFDQGWSWEEDDVPLESFFHGAGDMIFVPKTSKHKVTNIGETDLLILELQMGSECSEDDITRLEKINDKG